MATRRAAVAGTFYPGHVDELGRQVARYVAHPHLDVAVKALIVPHAGYVYSGAIAGLGYAAAAAAMAQARRIVVLGPSHRVFLTGAALPAASAFETPLGPVPVADGALAKLRSLRAISVNEAAHAEEHCIEVQLPFLQTLAPQCEILPLVVGAATPVEMARIIDAVWDDETLIVISTDLSHYHPDPIARRIDGATLGAIERFDTAALGATQACGYVPLGGLLHCAEQRGLRVRILAHGNSSDTIGSRNRVVGYAAGIVA